MVHPLMILLPLSRRYVSESRAKACHKEKIVSSHQGMVNLPMDKNISPIVSLPAYCLLTVYQGPVVQSVASLTSSLRVISLTILADSIYNILIFFAEKM